MDEKQYDAEAVKSRLIEYREAERELDNQIERLQYLTYKMTSISSQAFTDMPKAPSASHDRIAEIVGRKEELEDIVKQMIQSQTEVRERIDKILKRSCRPDEKAAIRMRYFDRMEWEEITKMLFGSKDDFEEKEATYLRRAHRAHRSGLEHMAAYISVYGGLDLGVSMDW